MLIGISPLISPELIKILMEMGHGDEIVLADGNFPAASMAQRLVRCDGHQMVDLLDAILQLFPLDQYDGVPVSLMAVVEGDKVDTPIWDDFAKLIYKYEPITEVEFNFIERYAFYDKAKKAYAIVATGESAQYANIILRKGVIATK